MTQDGATPEVAVPHDPLLCNMRMPLHTVLYPLGFPLEITTNSPAVIAAARESWGHFPEAFAERPVHLRVGVVGSGNGASLPAPTHRAWLNLMAIVTDAENFAVCDLRQGVAFCCLTETALADPLYLRYYFLEGPGLSLLEHRYLVSVHAACVRFADRGVLLCGDSGAGKSSLAYACALRGWTFVADDNIALIRGRKEREVIGNPNRIRFRETGVDLFPELSQYQAVRQVAGDRAIELATAMAPGISTALTSTADYVVFLNRQDSNPPGLAPFSKQKAFSWLKQVITFGEEEVRQAQVASLHTLMATEILELRYTELSTAVDLLESLILDGTACRLAESLDSLPRAENA